MDLIVHNAAYQIFTKGRYKIFNDSFWVYNACCMDTLSDIHNCKKWSKGWHMGCLSLHMLIMFWRYKVCVHDASDEKNIVLGL